MAEFRARVDARAPAQAVWELVTDWPAHSPYVPFTTLLRLTSGDRGVGERFVARTGVGRLAVEDPMEVVEWVPPTGTTTGRCTVAKLGPLVLGRAIVEVEPTGPATCRVSWYENVELAPVRLTRHAAPLVSAVGAAGFGRVLRGLAAEASR